MTTDDVNEKEEAVKTKTLMRKGCIKIEMLFGNRASSFSLSPADYSYCLVNSEMTTDDVNEKEEAVKS